MQRALIGTLAALTLLLSGCKQGEDLERRQQAAEKQLALLQGQLAQKERLQAEAKQLQIREARLSQQLIPPTPEAVEAAFASLPGLRVVAGEGAGIVVTGRALLPAFAERLTALGEAQPGVRLEVLRVDGDFLEARLGSDTPEEEPPPPRPSPIGQVLPWNQGRLEALRRTEAELAQVREQLPDAVEGRASLQWRVNALQDVAGRAAASRRLLVEAALVLTQGEKAALAPLELHLEEGQVVATGRTPPGVSPQQVRERVAPRFVAASQSRTVQGDVQLRLEAVPQPEARP